jgi:hypothetical protein
MVDNADRVPDLTLVKVPLVGQHNVDTTSNNYMAGHAGWQHVLQTTATLFGAREAS